MKHSNQIREFVINDRGLDLVDVYIGPDGILTGSAREAHQLAEVAGVELRSFALRSKDTEVERRRKVLAAKMDTLQQEYDSAHDELNRSYREEELKEQIIERNRQELMQKRSGNQEDVNL